MKKAVLKGNTMLLRSESVHGIEDWSSCSGGISKSLRFKVKGHEWGSFEGENGLEKSRPKEEYR